jgi:serine/threonine-protein kinase
MSGFDSTLASGPERTDRTGQVLGEKYRLARLIGEGGMGAVYEAQHLVVKRRFAVKLLRPELAKNTEAIARFRREAEAAGALESEHVAAVIDFGEAPDGAPYIVMEYLVGESVAALLGREGPLPVPRAVSILLQVCRGLEVAHDAGIVHRDLKPDNLFVVKRTDGSDLVKILDFGIAKLQGGPAGVQVTRTGSAPGTPHYMAPEQARGDKAIDRRTDIYALGVILYELLSGARPHPGDSYNAILAHILTKPPAPLATIRTGLPDGLARLVHRALATEPNDRPESAVEFAKSIASFVGREVLPVRSQLELRVAAPGSRTIATPDTSVRSVERPSKKRALSRVALVTLVPLVAVAGVLLARALREAPDGAITPTPLARGSEKPSAAAPTASPAESAGIAAVASQSPPFGSVAERSGDEPEARSALRARRLAPAPAKLAPAASSAKPPLASPSKRSDRGATFDPTNPYQ